MSATGFDYDAVPRLVRAYLPGSRTFLVAAVLLSVFSAFAELAVPYAVYQFLVHLVVGHGGLTAGPATGLAVVGVVVTYLSYGAGTALAHRVAFGVIARIRRSIGRRWARAAPGDISAAHTADARAAATEDADRLEGIIAHGIPETAAGVTVWLAMTVWMFVEDWRLALACSVVAPVALATMRRAMRANEHRMGEYVMADAAMGRAMMDQLTALVETRVFDSQAPSTRADEAIRHTTQLQTAWGSAFLRWGAWFSPLSAATPVVVGICGAWLLATGELGVETFLLFLVLAPAYTVPLVTLFYRMHTLPLAAAGARAVQAQLDGDPTPAAVAAPDAAAEGPAADLMVDAVHFSYPGRPEILTGVTVRIPLGATVALVGGSGSGKTTLLELLAGLATPHGGSVALGGEDTAALLEVPRRRISYTGQEPHLVAGTVAQNLRVGRPDAPEHLLLEALEAVGLRSELGPDALDRCVGEAGAGLSGGQRQRLALARMLIVGAGLVLMDEPTSSIDPLSEAELWDSIARWCHDRTVVVATHRMGLARRADLIVALDGLGGAEIGTPDELIGREGVYAGLYRADELAGRAVR